MSTREIVLEDARSRVAALGADFFDLVRENPQSEKAAAAREYFFSLDTDAQSIIEVAAMAEALLG